MVAKKLETLGFSQLKTIAPHGVAGSGLAILWKDWLNLEVISSCNSYFDTRVTYGGNMSYATFVYASTDKKKGNKLGIFLPLLLKFETQLGW